MQLEAGTIKYTSLTLIMGPRLAQSIKITMIPLVESFFLNIPIFCLVQAGIAQSNPFNLIKTELRTTQLMIYFGIVKTKSLHFLFLRTKNL